ncbi:flagellar basal-body MS-ring/collar protein FliF [Bacillota bacterium LX-D]|nr:flagellar basal-body MS-ring/collar protein FliF [Bacillota bacterium LX-D]
MNLLKKLIEQAKEKWKNLSKPQKSIVIIMALALLLSLLFLIQWATRVEYAPLFNDLEPKTASAVVDKLKDLNIPYKLENQGSTISVPKEQVYDARIQLAGAGVLTDTGLGFEIFDQTKVGVTDFVNDVNYQRALQEELRRTIVAFDEVDQARVHIVLPKESLFVEEEQSASAAVTVKLKPLAKLTPDQVEGIIYLVSSSVPNLPPENVRVIDGGGKVLSDDVDLNNNLSRQRLTQYELKRQFEKDMEKRVQAMLTTIFGEGNAIVMITADLNFDQVEQKQTAYDKGQVLGQQTSSEQGSSTGGTPTAVGDPNKTSQTSSYTVAGSGNSTYQKNSTTTNYKVPETSTVTVKAPGEIRNISASVVVDGQLTAQELANVQQVVATAIGYQATRGDQINVSSMAFGDGLNKTVPAAQTQAKSLLPPYVKWMALGAGVLLLGWFVLMKRRRKKEAAEEPIIEEILPVAPEEPIAVAPEISMEEKIKKEKQQVAKDIVRQKPDEAAQLIKAWLSED